jgi:hypothetical protein
MKEITLTKGYIALVDEEDFDELSKFKWHVKIGRHTFYARRSTLINENRPTSSILMARQVLRMVDPTCFIDHIDHNGLNNQKSNLRICTHQQNMANNSSRKNSSSKYIGVYFESWSKRKKKWRANISVNKKHINIGLFFTEEEAAIARDKFVIKNGLDFYRLNILYR